MRIVLDTSLTSAVRACVTVHADAACALPAYCLLLPFNEAKLVFPKPGCKVEPAKYAICLLSFSWSNAKLLFTVSRSCRTCADWSSVMFRTSFKINSGDLRKCTALINLRFDHYRLFERLNVNEIMQVNVRTYNQMCTFNRNCILDF